MHINKAVLLFGAAYAGSRKIADSCKLITILAPFYIKIMAVAFRTCLPVELIFGIAFSCSRKSKQRYGQGCIGRREMEGRKRSHLGSQHIIYAPIRRSSR